MNIYFISEFNDKGNNAGSKARNDLEQIFVLNKWRKINDKPIVTSTSKRHLAYFIKSFIDAMLLYYKLSYIRGSIIFCQYPVLKGSIIYNALRKISKTNKLCFIVHDINALRAPEEQRKSLLEDEISILNEATAVIVHNDRMKNVLIENGLMVKNIVELRLFDYLANNKKMPIRNMSRTVVYAGNLKKSSFINKLYDCKELEFQINLYGSNFDCDNKHNSKINYVGSFPPDEVVGKLDGSFGLVWDGPSLNTCEGLMGDYMRYNNPHKLSLYIAAGLPVIVWSQAAISKFVMEHNIGFTVDNILGISEKLDNINQAIYAEYLENINLLREKVINGYYTREALNKAIYNIYHN